MMRAMAFLGLLSSPLLTSGCDPYFYGDDDDDCTYGGAEGDRTPIYEQYLRDPQSGQCEWYGGGYPPCDNECGPCPLDEPESDGVEPSVPTWAMCDGYCESLDEMTCWATTGCRAAYIVDGGATAFWECWGTDQSGPIQGGGCSDLDAYACSIHDDCIAVHALDLCGAGADEPVPEPCSALGWFEYCADEPAGCYGDNECGQGQRCNAGEVCLSPPGCEDIGNGSPDCAAVCYGYCVPADEPGPGTCYGDVVCDSLPPSCPAETTPGVLGGCWSGYCIPLTACADPPVACAAIADELTCVARTDCTPFYEGVDCVCDELGNCECADWLFVSCD